MRPDGRQPHQMRPVKITRDFLRGEILISYGEFIENNHLLIPSVYCEEWWQLEGGCGMPATELEAVALCFEGAFLHPDYTWFWDDIDTVQVRELAGFVEAHGEIRHGILLIPNEPGIKAILEEILIPHMVREGMICISTYKVLLACFGLDLNLKRRKEWESAPMDHTLGLVAPLRIPYPVKGGHPHRGENGAAGEIETKEDESTSAFAVSAR